MFRDMPITAYLWGMPIFIASGQIGPSSHFNGVVNGVMFNFFRPGGHPDANNDNELPQELA